MERKVINFAVLTLFSLNFGACMLTYHVGPTNAGEISINQPINNYDQRKINELEAYVKAKSINLGQMGIY